MRAARSYAPEPATWESSQNSISARYALFEGSAFSTALCALSQQIAMMVRRVSWMHECIFAGPKREDRRVSEEGRPQGRDRPTFRSRSSDGQTLLQATRRARNARTQEGSRQSPEARREGDEATLRRSREEALGYPLPKGRIPVRSDGGEGERSDGLPSGRTPAQEPKKRSTGAAERDEFLRVLWRMKVGRLDPGRLVFVDEMGTHTSLAPLYAYAPVGERAFFEIPRNRGKNTTLLTSLHRRGMGPSLAVEGATTSRVFETYVKRLLAPTLRPGQVVVMDNLGAHRPRRVRELIEGRGCELIYLPSYSPDLNPIEEALSKIKHILRKTCARTKEHLIEARGRALGAVSAQDGRGFFLNCGYSP